MPPVIRELEIWNAALARVGGQKITPETPVAITAVSSANPPRVTTGAPHGYADGDVVLLYDTTSLENTGRVFAIDSIAGSTFDLLREPPGAGGSGGFAARLPNVKIVRSCFGAWPTVRDEVLQSYAWKCAETFTRLARLDAARTITAITQANPAVVTTSAPHGLVIGDQVLIDGIVGMVELNGRWQTVGNVPTTTTFQIAGEDSTLYTAWASGGTVRKALQPLRVDHTYTNRYDLPVGNTDFCLRVLSVAERPEGDGQDWTRVGNEVFCDDGIVVPIRYTRRLLRPDLYDPLLLSALEARLAAEIAVDIADSTADRQQLWDLYQAILARARKSDSSQRSPARFEPFSWESRRWG